MNATWELAYRAGLIIQTQNKDTHLAAEHFSLAIELATNNILSIEADKLAYLYQARMKCYEILGLHHHARQDYQKLLEADPNFI